MSSDSETDTDIECTPPNLRAEAKLITENLLPAKSKERYIKTYDQFVTRKSEQKAHTFSESVLLANFNYLAKSKQPSSLWTIYSMLQCTIQIKHDVDIKEYNCFYLPKQFFISSHFLRKALYKPFTSPDRNMAPEKVREMQRQPSKDSTGRSKMAAKAMDSSNSESDSGDVEGEKADALAGSGRKRAGGVVIPAEGAYDPKQFQDLKVPPDMENIFQYIMKYTPQKIDIDFKLQPFVPEYVPAVGDIDAFIKVATPACNVRGQPLPETALEHIDNLGLTVLDEPAADQSDSALLHLQLRAISKTNSARTNVLTKKVENAEKNSKAIERWIKDVSELHLSKPAPTVSYTSKMPDIDTLMEEWPENMEETLNEVGFPPASLDCSLSQYVELVCAVFDVPIVGDGLAARIQALHLLFSLYSAVKNSQLYAERQKEKEEVS